MIYPVIDDELIECGYHEFKKGPLDHEGIETKFQKRFDDEVGKKYFITVDKWAVLTHPHTGEKIGPGYEFTTQFSYCGNPINVNCFSGWDIEEAEAKIEEMWQKCSFDYYEIFDPNESERRVPREQQSIYAEIIEEIEKYKDDADDQYCLGLQSAINAVKRLEMKNNGI